MTPLWEADSERVVLSACFVRAGALDAVGAVLRPSDLSRSHGEILNAMLALKGSGAGVDLVALAQSLRERGRLEAVGGSAYLADLIDAVPAVANVDDHVQRIRAATLKREARRLFTAAAAEAQNGIGDVAAWLATQRTGIDHLLEGREAGLPVATTPEIFRPNPPVEYLLRSLDFCPGAPVLVAGYGFSGKTVAVQSMALSVAAGCRVWGTYEVDPGMVLHLDYEQGFRLTTERYQRLAHALMLAPQDLHGRLTLASMPRLYLEAPEAEATLLRSVEGHRLLIVDSLRASAPNIDENSSDVRRVLDLLTRVSERTGVTVVMIHHARKPPKERDTKGGAKMAIRGSGAIFDACSSVLVFDGPKGGPVRVTHEKARSSGVLSADIELIIEDVPDGHNPRAGLNVTAQAASMSDDEPPSDVVSDGRRAAHDEKILELIRANPGANVRALRGLARPMRNGEIDDAIARLLASGKVDARPGARGAIHHFARA